MASALLTTSACVQKHGAYAKVSRGRLLYCFRSLNRAAFARASRSIQWCAAAAPWLIVPEPRERLGIRVENQIYRWREGEVVIFDTGKICNKALDDKAFGVDQDFLGTPGVRSPINLPVTGSW